MSADRHSDDRQRTVTLDDLCGYRPVEEWREASWSECTDCSGPLIGPLDEDEKTFDGEPLVCSDPGCGLVHQMHADADGWAVLAQTDMSGRWVYLTAAALAEVTDAR